MSASRTTRRTARGAGAALAATAMTVTSPSQVAAAKIETMNGSGVPKMVVLAVPIPCDLSLMVLTL